MKFLFVGLCFYIILLGDYASAQKHQLSPVGGYRSINTDDENVQKLALFSLDSVTQQTMSKRSLGLFKVVSAKSQVVAGINYKMELLVCEKDSDIVLDNKNCRSCDITIWEQSWLNSKNVTKVACSEPSEVNSFLNVAVTKRDIHENVAVKTSLNSNDKKTQDVTSDFAKKGKATVKKNQYDRIQLKADFENFINTHNKKYSSLEEKEKRLRIFSANMKRVKLLQNNEQGTAIYGATQFADLTKNEFKKKYLGLNHSEKSKKIIPMAEIPRHISIPDEFDWRDHNAVTPVKNQGACGSCWAFSAIANIEGQYALKSGKLLSLSEQELIDCDNLDSGCGGGLMTQAFEAVENLGGLEMESDYPYEGHSDSKGCQLDKSELKVSISKAVNVSTNEDDIAKFLVSHGPLSVGVNANAMQFYMGGVSHPIHALCSAKSLDHGVAIVGYGVHRTKYTHKNLPYWLIKNSWGSGWGEKGYYLLYRGDGSCGVNQMVSSAII